jgi:hypothetical protein
MGFGAPEDRRTVRQVVITTPAYASGWWYFTGEHMEKLRICKDCSPDSKRPAPNPGPRCASHWRAVRLERKKASHEKMVERTYGLPPGHYDALKAFQGGVCWICQRATGKVKALAVDHDHVSGAPRGVLCGVCNQLLGHLRDEPARARRIAQYLEDPPYQQFLRQHSDDEV